jgi:hypothetical protein
MSDRIFLHLCPGWALGYNKLQWMIMKADKMPPEGVLSLPTARFRAVSFIACYKRVLCRVLREKGITPTPKAQSYIDAMPDTFREWQQLRKTTPVNSNNSNRSY